jgi:hypothetical protein
MDGTNRKKRTSKRRPEERSQGLWMDTTLIARLHGRKALILTSSIVGAETERLLHYADVSLGTDGKEKLVSSAPTKSRKVL